MCLDELHDICGLAGLFDEKFVDRDADLVYNFIFIFFSLLIYQCYYK